MQYLVSYSKISHEAFYYWDIEILSMYFTYLHQTVGPQKHTELWKLSCIEKGRAKNTKKKKHKKKIKTYLRMIQGFLMWIVKLIV